MVIPTTYRSSPVLPIMPTTPIDRETRWTWTSVTAENPASGAQRVDATSATARLSLAYEWDGLTRAQLHTLHQFFEARQGGYGGFWAPSWRWDFHTVPTPAGWPTFGHLKFADWGYRTAIHPLGSGHRHLAAVKGSQWYLGRFTGTFYTPGGYTTPDGTAIIGADISESAGDFAGDRTTLNTTGGASASYAADRLVVMRLLWVRLAGDAVTTKWHHPNLGGLRVEVVTDFAGAP
jgi:hypothetical protein